MFEEAQRIVIALSERAQRAEIASDLRKLTVMTARSLRRNTLLRDIEGLTDTERRHVEETSTWVGAKALVDGEGGAFDVLDLRCWLALAERAGVLAVPAATVVELDDGEMDAASNKIEAKENPVVRGIKRMISKDPALQASGYTPAPASDPASVHERLASAMDEVPEGWMVRYARCGGSNLKSLAGFGVAGPTAPEVRFGPDLEVGPGWIRRGNRRVVDASNLRTLQAAASGPGAPHAFLARPWVAPARWAYGPDPHRHGTQFAGKGAWPAEWRAFIVDGKVEGVASYYGWCGAPTPRNARIALAVRDLAQRIADEAVRQGAHPRFADLELTRSSGHPDLEGNPIVVAEMSRLARDKVAMTLDFIEAFRGPDPYGLVLLEGGPPVSVFGGGHPCAFAGAGGQPKGGVRTITEGVAFRLMEGVLIADPATWQDGDRTGRFMDWAEVLTLAASQGPEDEVPPELRSGTPALDYRSPVDEPDTVPSPGP